MTLPLKPLMGRSARSFGHPSTSLATLDLNVLLLLRDGAILILSKQLEVISNSSGIWEECSLMQFLGGYIDERSWLDLPGELALHANKTDGLLGRRPAVYREPYCTSGSGSGGGTG
jgi:hypothetical protein